MGSAIVRAVEQHSADTRLADDLTILLLRRLAIVADIARSPNRSSKGLK